MKTIWKFVMKDRMETIPMPVGAEIVTAQMQGNDICLWAMVDPRNQKTELRVIEIFGTGFEMPPARRKYIATVQSGWFVWHIFERFIDL